MEVELEAKWIGRYDSWSPELGKAGTYSQNTAFMRQYVSGDSWVTENEVNKAGREGKVAVDWEAGERLADVSGPESFLLS